MRTTIQYGSKGPDAILAQICLQKGGYYKGKIDGWFGPMSVNALKRFQRATAHTPDGVCGPKTWPDLLKYKPHPVPAPIPTPTTLKILSLDYVKQPDIVTCACVTGNRMLANIGIASTIEQLRTLMKTQPLNATSPGTTPDNFQAGLVAAAGEQGKKIKFTATVLNTLQEVKTYIDMGVALGLHGGTVPCMDYKNYYGHYITVIGYNLDKAEVCILDSSRGKKWVPWACLQSFIQRRSAANPWKIATL